jgi:hypothetical protein
MNDEERAQVFDDAIAHLYEAGRLVLNGQARDESVALPPTPAWEDLDTTPQVAFALQAYDMVPHLMSLVEHIGRGLGQEAATGGE